ncbi:MAG: DinB family protein [Bryobacteraceae bacterium]|nr:DinB family protein [Bryobacteraceae bacterium]
MSEQLSSTEREYLVNYLETTARRFADTVESLTDEEWQATPAEAVWSPAQISEHMVLTESRIARMLRTRLSPAGTAVSVEDRERVDALILKRVPDRTPGRRRMEAPEPLHPANRWPDRFALLEEFRRHRGATIAFVNDTELPLRAHTAPHPMLGTLDGYQWILFLGAHVERHVRQMEETCGRLTARRPPD